MLYTYQSFPSPEGSIIQADLFTHSSIPMYARGTAFRSVTATALMLGFLVSFSIAEAARSDRSPLSERIETAKERRCDRLEKALARIPVTFPLPPFCTVTPPPPVDVCPLVMGMQTAGPCASDACVAPAAWDLTAQSCVTPPPPVDACPLVTGMQTAGPCASDQCVLPATWDTAVQSCVTPPPVDVCPLVTGVQESAPCASDLCVLPATWSTDTQACVTPPPPSLNHIVITEVYYDVDATHGAETTHEWIELYNPTAAPVALDGWSIVDTSGSVDTIPDGTTVPAGGYIVLAASSTLSNFWTIPAGAVLVNMGGSLGNALGNTGDSLILRNVALATVDALSWGSDVTVFATPAPDVAEGHSLARSPVGADTDVAADWVDREVPTLGE